MGSLTDNSRGVIYKRNIFIVQASGLTITKPLTNFLRYFFDGGAAYDNNGVDFLCYYFVAKAPNIKNGRKTVARRFLILAFTLGVTSFSITTLSIMGLFTTLSINDIQHNLYSVILRVSLR